MKNMIVVLIIIAALTARTDADNDKVNQMQNQQQSASKSSSSTSSSTLQSLHSRKLIINGQEAPRGRYPYFSTLHHECGGALIAPDVVLTAGHCLPTHLNSVKPHVGTYSFLSGDTKTHETFQIVNMTRHGHWQRLGEDEFRHDLALLFLDRPAHNHTYIKLNRNENLPTFVHEEGQVLTAMGVGWTSNDYRNAKKAMVLQEVNLEYLPNDECELFYDQDVDDDDEDEDGPSDYLGRIQHDHLCTTGGPENKRDACAFDSGSPIIIKGENARQDVLVALVSWGEGCADPNFPGVNTRITDGLDFINESVCQMSSYAPPEFGCPGTETTPTVIEETYTFRRIGAGLIFLIMVGCFTKRLIARIRQPRNNKEYDAIAWTSPLQTLHKPWMNLQKRFSDYSTSSETECLNSPASSVESKGSRDSYDAIESLTI